MPYERANKQSRHKGWLVGELEGRHAVQITCTKCSHQPLIAPHFLYARFETTVGLAALKLRCTACGCREVTWQVMTARAPRKAKDW